jgi:hypothetical protein
MAARSKAAARGAPATEGEEPDLRQEALALRRDVALLADAPPRTARERARHDAWRTILKPRLGELLRRLGDLGLARRYEFDAGDRAVLLLPGDWDHVVRQVLAPVHARLAGALAQYHSVGVVWSAKLRFGIGRGKNALVGTTKALEAQAAAAERALRAAERATREGYRKTMEEVLMAFAAARDTLAGHLQRLQALVARLMEREEARLARRVSGLAEGSPVRRDATAHLETMRMLRLDARDLSPDGGRGASAWTSLVRRWLAPRRELARRLG